jgi:hypothetical protein
MLTQLKPICEPVFSFAGHQYVAHCLPDELGMGALEVTIHQIRDGATRYVGYGVYSKRFVSYELHRGMRRAVNVAIKVATQR